MLDADVTPEQLRKPGKPDFPLLSRIRSGGKRTLAGTPFYAAGKWLWERVKAVADRHQFRRRYPDADYIILSKTELARLRERGFASQFGQDRYLFDQVLSGRASGTFIDIGANDPLSLSNSLYLEKSGWKGFAIDPIRSLAPRWAETRKTIFVNAAVSSLAEQRRFVEVQPQVGWEHQLSAFEGFVRPEDLAIYQTRIYSVHCAPLYELIDQDFRADVVLIDVEGAELIVLDGLELDKHKPEIIVCENVSVMGGDQAIRTRLECEGYCLVARLGASDDVFRLGSSALGTR